jgi:2-polyprenyl-3-methyl-5-hydroxy-6-metoxy-1,4-benzoquinol methylase
MIDTLRFMKFYKKTKKIIMKLISHLTSKLRHSRDAHRAARKYWSGCSCSLLASDPTYYDRQENVLRTRFMPTIGSHGTALDVGCGNGRFSMVISEWATKIDALDISPTLIKEGKRVANEKKIKNINFDVIDLELGLPSKQYELIACMGVMSTLINEGPYLALCKYLADSLNQGGWLILKDTLSLELSGELINTVEYTTHYRNIDMYLGVMKKHGFNMYDEVLMAEESNRINKMYLMKKEQPKLH